MAFCGKCGAQMADDMKFCPSCGAPVNAPDQSGNAQAASESAAAGENTRQSGQNGAQAGTQQGTEGIASKLKGLNNTADTTTEYDTNDIEQNKLMAVLSYLGFFVLVPIFAAQKSKYARFHANQGLTLFILDVAYGIVQAIIMAILRAIFPAEIAIGSLFNVYATRGVIYNILSLVFSLPWIVIAVLVIIGIVNAVHGKAKELPVIGKIKLLK